MAVGEDLPIRPARSLRGWADALYITRWLPSYRKSDFRRDVAAGVTVAVMLIPMSMAYALLLGVPPLYGLYASLVPLLVYPLLGTGMHLAVGIVAIDMLIANAGLGRLAPRGSERYLDLAILLTVMVGVLQVLMGVARLGFLVNLLSRSVVVGFTSGAALLIAASQVGGLLGLSLPTTSHIHELALETLRHVHEIRVVPVVLGITALMILLFLRRRRPLFPAHLATVGLGTLAVWLLDLQRFGVEVVGSAPTGLPRFSLPTWETASVWALVPTAVTLALVQFMTLVSLGRVFASRFRYAILPNRELVALGAANLTGGLFRALPVSVSFSRTAVNVQAGARTPVANWVAAGVVALVLLFLTPLLSHVPIPVLAAIIIVAAMLILDVEQMRLLRRIRRSDGAVAFLTFIATVLIGIQEGIIIGVVTAVTLLLYRISRPKTAILGHLAGTRTFRDVVRTRQAELLEGILILRVDASFSFMNAEYLKDLILSLSRDPERGARALVIDAVSIIDLDATAVAVLQEVKETLDARGVEFYMAGVSERVMDVIQRSGLEERIGPDHFFLSTHRAVRHILTRWGTPDEYLKRLEGSEAIGPA